MCNNGGNLILILMLVISIKSKAPVQLDMQHFLTSTIVLA